MILKYVKILIAAMLISAFLLAREWVAAGTDHHAEPAWGIKSLPGNETEIVFNLSGYYLEKVDQGKTRITFPGGVPIMEKGAPDLPRMARSIIIPDLGRMELDIIAVSYTHLTLPTKRMV